jgi:hypothetical protein
VWKFLNSFPRNLNHYIIDDPTISLNLLQFLKFSLLRMHTSSNLSLFTACIICLSFSRIPNVSLPTLKATYRFPWLKVTALAPSFVPKLRIF